MPLQPPGWENRNAYPLLLEREAKRAMIKMMMERNLSEGKALNILVREGLVVLGYLTPPKTPLQLQEEAARTESDWVKAHWAEMSDKARDYWIKRYPDAVSVPVSPEPV